MSRPPTYSDQALARAVAGSHSWRGVLRVLGLNATSAGAIRSVRRHADRSGLDTAHIVGRRWTNDQLAAAIAAATSWSAVVEALGLAEASSQSMLKGHAARLGLKVDHLNAERLEGPRLGPSRPDRANLSRAGSMIAATWFTLCGDNVSWPLEPCRYDLVVDKGDRVDRVQVKTTTVRSGSAWTVWLSSTRKGRTPYSPDEIDSFFIVDGDFGLYLIPVGVVGGYHAISLGAYSHYKLADSWLPPA